MEQPEALLLELFVIFAGGKFLGWIAERLRQPSVLGELLAGVLLGPSVLAWVHPSKTIAGLAEIGAIFLLFTVGLETRPRDLLRVGKTATLVAIAGVVLPFAFGYFYMKFTGHTVVEAMFLAAAMVATSVGITASVLKGSNALRTLAARVILAAAVVDDVLGMLVLAVVGSLAAGPVRYVQLAITAGEAILFFAVMLVFGSRLVSRLEPAITRRQGNSAMFSIAVALCLGLSIASVYVGMAAIIGAFLAGLMLAEQSHGWQLAEKVHPLYEFLTPFFFVYLGTEVNVRALIEPGVPMMAGIVFLLAAVSKLVGCGLGAWTMGLADALRVGIGMIPRGEVGLIVAAVGLEMHVISDRVYVVVVLMSLLTTLIAPPLLRPLLPQQESLPAPGES